jgi:hypothetical protein
MVFRNAIQGRWIGKGRGWYPTIADFEYQETLEISDTGRPFLTYRQITQANDGSPMHTEVGYFRFLSDNRLEFVVAQPTGISEVLAGSIEPTEDGYLASLQAYQLARTETSKSVEATSRRLLLQGESLSVEFWMAAMGQPMQQHLSSQLRRDA